MSGQKESTMSFTQMGDVVTHASWITFGLLTVIVIIGPEYYKSFISRWHLLAIHGVVTCITAFRLWQYDPTLLLALVGTATQVWAIETILYVYPQKLASHMTFLVSCLCFLGLFLVYGPTDTMFAVVRGSCKLLTYLAALSEDN